MLKKIIFVAAICVMTQTPAYAFLDQILGGASSAADNTPLAGVVAEGKRYLGKKKDKIMKKVHAESSEAKRERMRQELAAQNKPKTEVKVVKKEAKPAPVKKVVPVAKKSEEQEFREYQEYKAMKARQAAAAQKK